MKGSVCSMENLPEKGNNVKNGNKVQFSIRVTI